MHPQHSLHKLRQLRQDAIELLRQLDAEDGVHEDGVDAGEEHIGAEESAPGARVARNVALLVNHRCCPSDLDVHFAVAAGGEIHIVLRHEGEFYPSLALRAVQMYLGSPPIEVTFAPPSGCPGDPPGEGRP